MGTGRSPQLAPDKRVSPTMRMVATRWARALGSCYGRSVVPCEDLQDKPTRLRPTIVVQKYGGSSVADVDKLGRVADRIVAARRAGNHVVAVVSAMGKTTDDLLRLAAEVAGEQAEPPRRELDMLVSTGERVAMSLLSIGIQARGLDAISFTGSQCGIITNDRHFDARIIEVRPHRIEDELARGRVVIVAGYQGMSYKREITTLGRGGTDTTAVALAAALGAERCEIYSDVDGIYSADPRHVADARHLPEVDYDMLQEMAESGAKVVCAQAVQWAKRAGIAIYARSTFEPLSQRPRQTVVRKFQPHGERRARAVTAHADLALLSVVQAGSSAGLLAALRDAELGLVHVRRGAGHAAALVSLTNTPDWSAAQRVLRKRLPSLQVRQDVGLVSAVGDGLLDRAEPLARFCDALDEVGIEPLLLWGTALRLSAVIPREALPEAQRAVHQRLA